MNNNIIVQEHTSEKYSPRTYFNAKSGDVTVAFAVDLTTAGELLTHKAAGDKYIGFHLTDETQSIDLARQLYKKMKTTQAKTLNIAGNGIYTLSKYSCDQHFANTFVLDVISKVHEHYQIQKIFTGGQTGIDLAGAVVANILNIPAIITLPKGFIQRFENKIDIQQTQQDIITQIDHWTQLLNNKIKIKP